MSYFTFIVDEMFNFMTAKGKKHIFMLFKVINIIIEVNFIKNYHDRHKKVATSFTKFLSLDKTFSFHLLTTDGTQNRLREIVNLRFL